MIQTTGNFSAQAQFLQQARSGAGFVCFRPVGGTLFEKHFTDIGGALKLIDLYGKQADTWVSMATYSTPGESRSQKNAGRLCALWLDIDAHEGSEYKSVEDVKTALNDFLHNTGLPKPSLLHCTGYGIHAIWTFTQAIPKSEWQPVAAKLQNLTQRLNLGADPITADAARILRVPGTMNFRNPDEPKQAELEETGLGHQEFDVVTAAIDEALMKFPAEAKERGKHISAKKFDCPETNENIALVEAMLAVINPDMPYPEWRDAVWSVAATGWDRSYDIARAFSERGSSWDDDAFNRVWGSFDCARGIGFGTLVHYARQSGYSGQIPTSSKSISKEGSRTTSSGGLVTVCAADIQPEHVEWLVDQSLPLGMLAVIGGQPGLGKSQISINLAAGVTTGKGLPGGAAFNNHGSVIILANEDDAARTIRPRLDAAEADISKVHIVQGVAREGASVDMFQLDADISGLRDRAQEIGDVRLIIIDPPSAYLGSKVDSYKDSDVRRVLMPLGNLAHETGAMILLIVHLNKRTDGGAQQRFSGSTAWTAAPRVGFMVVEDPLTKQRLMLPVKNNIGDDRLGYQYHIAEKLIQFGGQTFKSSHIVWDQTTNRSVAELIALPKAAKTSAVDDAKTFLEDELANGPVRVEKITVAAKDAGISWSSVTRAKGRLPITSTKVGDGWMWALFASEENGNV